jgi:hypothetical protein
LVSVSFAGDISLEAPAPDGWTTTMAAGWGAGGDSAINGTEMTYTLANNDTYGKTWTWNIVWQSWNDASSPINGTQLWDHVSEGGVLQFDLTWDFSGLVYDPLAPNPDNVNPISCQVAVQIADSSWSVTNFDQTDGLAVVGPSYLTSGTSTQHVVKDLSNTADFIYNNWGGDGTMISAIQVVFGLQAAPGYSGVIVANIQNMEIPEPMTIAMLGLGSLALIRRKK